MITYEALYTKDIHKKKAKCWLDGKVEFNQASRKVTLFELEPTEQIIGSSFLKEIDFNVDEPDCVIVRISVFEVQLVSVISSASTQSPPTTSSSTPPQTIQTTPKPTPTKPTSSLTKRKFQPPRKLVESSSAKQEPQKTVEPRSVVPHQSPLPFKRSEIMSRVIGSTDFKPAIQQVAEIPQQRRKHTIMDDDDDDSDHIENEDGDHDSISVKSIVSHEDVDLSFDDDDLVFKPKFKAPAPKKQQSSIPINVSSVPKGKQTPNATPPTTSVRPVASSTVKASVKRRFVVDDDLDEEDFTSVKSVVDHEGNISMNDDDDLLGPMSPKKRFKPVPLPRQTSPTVSSSIPSPQKLSPRSSTPSPTFKSPLQQSRTTSSASTDMPVLDMIFKATGERHRIWFPDSELCNLFMNTRSQPKRSVILPDRFKSVDEYRTIFTLAVYEDVNLQVFKLAFKFRRAYDQITSASGKDEGGTVPSCPHGKMVLKVVKKDGANKGRAFYSCPKGQGSNCSQGFKWADQGANSSSRLVRHISKPKERQDFFRTASVPFYSACEFTKAQNLQSKKWKKQPIQYNSRVTQYYLKIGEKEQGSPYSKDDVWFISNNHDFNKDVLVCRSIFHGPTSDGSIEMKPIFGKVSSINENRDVYAIRGPNFSSELEAVDLFSSLNGNKLPILSTLLGDPDAYSEDAKATNIISFNIGMEPEEISQKAEEFIREYHMNEDQAQVIRNCSKWFMPNESTPDIHLVHGVFGAGKSFMLVVLVLFLCELLEEANNTDIRIMISSVTNVAVDRVLQGLITENYENVVRIGSQKKIAKAILPYTISSEKSQVDIVRDLKQMLKKPMDAADTAGVKKALKDVQSGAFEKKKDSVKTCRVVGVTCAASAFEILKGNKFPIIILDESSQCVEPLALLPMARFGCQKLIAVGDPQQLTPTLPGSFGRDDPDTIEKTLFIRLSKVGFTPQLLRTQYRCHPAISALSNQMFYDGRLIDGISEEDRPAMIYNMPPVMFINVPNGKEQAAADGSFSNEEEVNTIIDFLQLLTKRKDVTRDNVGVISLYRSQRFKIKLAMKKIGMKSIKISTVDAFQGGERDIIILTACRTSNNLSFIENEKRLNVALSRAKRHLVIVGKQDTLENSKFWQIVIKQAQGFDNGISSAERVKSVSMIEDLFLFRGSSSKFVAPPDQDDEKEYKFGGGSGNKRVIDDDDEDDVSMVPSKRVIDDDDDEELISTNLLATDQKEVHAIDQDGEEEITFEEAEEEKNPLKRKLDEDDQFEAMETPEPKRIRLSDQIIAETLDVMVNAPDQDTSNSSEILFGDDDTDQLMTDVSANASDIIMTENQVEPAADTTTPTTVANQNTSVANSDDIGLDLDW